MEHNFHNKQIERIFNYIVARDLDHKDLYPVHLNNLSLSNTEFSALTNLERRKVKLAYLLGELNGLLRLDELLTLVQLDPLESINEKEMR